MRDLCLVSHTGHPHVISTTVGITTGEFLYLPACRIPHVSHDQMVTLCHLFPGDVRDLSDLHHFVSLLFFFFCFSLFYFFYTEKRKRIEDSEGYSCSAKRVQCTLRWTWACPGFWHVFCADKSKLSFTYKISHSHERMFQLTDNPWWWIFCEP